MDVHLYLAPAAGGKTTFLVRRARELSAGLAADPRVIVPTRLQVRAWRRRLAESGGALGVRASTFDALYREILRAAGEVYARLNEPTQYRLLRALADAAPLQHYATLRTSPGFIQVLLDLIQELKAGGIFPEKLAEAVQSLGGEPRLAELALLYEAYQRRLRLERWTDPAGTGWLAAETLESHPDIGRDWAALFVDGFDDLTTVQIRVLQELAPRVGQMIVTLTGEADGRPRGLLHKRFQRTRERLEESLGVKAEPLPALADPPGRAPALVHLERTLFTGARSQEPAGGAVELVAAPDREGEVRAALRWLKSRLIHEKLRPSEVALLARRVEPYRPFIQQVAAEFGLPIYLDAGLPLRGNLAVAALLNLLRLALPGSDSFAWRPTVEAWRSPYLNWEAVAVDADGEPLGITVLDAADLDWVARWASVVGGLEQWEQAFELLTDPETAPVLDEERPERPAALPSGSDALALRNKFRSFVRRITPPAGDQPCRAFVAWIEGLIGESDPPHEGPPTDLGVVRRVLEGPPELIERDMAALNALKDVLRGLVWADEAVGCAPASFAAFFTDLLGAIDAAAYHLPLPADQEALLVAGVTQARGVPFRAVAVLGLAEGEFPAVLTEDPFLRDADRQVLRDRFGMPLNISTDSAEAEYFYEALTRPSQALLLTRPRIADNGAIWKESPFWEEVRRRVEAPPRNLTGSTYPAPAEAASWSELLLGAAGRSSAAEWDWLARRAPERVAALDLGAAIIRQRTRAAPDAHGPYDGDLSAWAATFGQVYGPGHVWSVTRLESYRSCPFQFFVGGALRLEPRPEPTEGLDGRQLGNIYHRILERLYKAVGDPTDKDQLLAALPGVAGPILDAAPRQEQFRPTRWWERTRGEILEHLRDTLEALAALPGDYRPIAYEADFGFPKSAHGPQPVPGEGGEAFLLHGVIDRVDRAPGDRLRIIDYKAGGPEAFTNAAVVAGEKLQLPLYGLAAEGTLGFGHVGDGFYWHLQHAAPSAFSLAKFKGREGQAGPQEAMRCAAQHAWEAIRGVRAGHFRPRPPDKDCPDYCPAAGFCWRYTAKE